MEYSHYEYCILSKMNQSYLFVWWDFLEVLLNKKRKMQETVYSMIPFL